MFWWSIITSAGREFYVRGGSFFAGAVRHEAEERLDEGETIVSWARKSPMIT